MYINPRTNKYMGHSPKEKPTRKLKSSPRGLCDGTIPPYCPRVFLESAHTNKLMIIAKESITQQNTQQ